MALDRLKQDPAPDEARTVGGSRRRSVKRALFAALNLLPVLAALALLISSFLFPVLRISGDSMEPGLKDGDIILLIRTRELDPGDLIGFRLDKQTLLKRVIARQGDWVMMDETGRVYVNGTLLDEPYVARSAPGESDISYPFQVPDDSYFVMGDNRIYSVDSRSTHVGCVKKDQIIGKGVTRIWSFD